MRRYKNQWFLICVSSHYDGCERLPWVVHTWEARTTNRQNIFLRNRLYHPLDYARCLKMLPGSSGLQFRRMRMGPGLIETHIFVHVTLHSNFEACIQKTNRVCWRYRCILEDHMPCFQEHPWDNWNPFLFDPNSFRNFSNQLAIILKSASSDE